MFGCFGSASNKIQPYSSSSGTTRVDLTDLTCPHTWYPLARRKQRRVILHVGPTNSGKTHHALKQLESSSSGLYCGPLRLLAWEVAKRMNRAKVACDLITGQEREEVDGAKHKAVTVEMADVAFNYQCAVIDEIQMLGCNTRGFSFTRALLGIAADELHLCGDPAAVPLIKEILKVTGDEVEVQFYERLSPLVPLKIPLGSFSNIRKGDCIVTFSRREIYRLKDRGTGQMIGLGRESQGLYHLTLPPSPVACSSTELPAIRHSHLGHPSLFKLRRMVPRLSSLSNLDCESCQLGKQSRTSFPKRVINWAFAPFELVHFDVWGPNRVTSVLDF